MTATRQQVHQILSAAYGAELADELLSSYDDVVNEYTTQHWKTAELDAGHFVEAVRRILELEHAGAFTPIGKTLPRFNEGELQKLAQDTNVGDTFAILLPRTLFAIYAIRNKRGAGHKGVVKPNEMDAMYILHSAKWILAEIVRVKSSASPADTLSLIEEIVERQVSVLWSRGDITRVLASGLTTKQEVLLLLYGSKDPLSVEDLMRFTDYAPRNKGRFTIMLLQLHRARQIEFSKDEEICVLTPKGITEAETLLLKARF
jgi:hypothetical protein